MILTKVDAQHNEDAVYVLHLGKKRLILHARADEEEGIKYRDPTVLIDRRPNEKNTFKKINVTVVYRTKGIKNMDTIWPMGADKRPISCEPWASFTVSAAGSDNGVVIVWLYGE